ncbi:MAG TPA: cysteine synthase family protein [Anaerolineae bacterium]|nr:cysteine synthase family protein [Anaerolineae bacterium]
MAITFPTSKIKYLNSSFQLPGDALFAQVGHTPLLPLHRISAEFPNVEIYAKAEWFNPSGSVKDRAAREIILTAERDGLLTPDKVLLDATSGNMGIAYSTLCAARGYRVKLMLPANASYERIITLKALGADLVLTDRFEGTDGAQLEARSRYAAEPDRYFYADQYNNPANWRAHYRTTAPEIWEQTDGRVTHFVAGLGTSGTMTGTGRRLKELNPNIELIAVQPDSPLHGLEGLKHMASAIKPGIFDAQLPDQNLTIGTEESQSMVKRLAREEGLFVGVSAGAAVATSLKIAAQIGQGVIVAVLPDSAYKYLSDKFWSE